MSDTGATEPLPSSRRAATRAQEEDLRVEGGRNPRQTPDLVGDARDRDRASRSSSNDGAGSSSQGPVEVVQRPENRTKLLLGTAAVTLLNLLLLLVILANVTGTSYERVNVDGAPCVLEVAGDDSILYCQR